VSLHNDSLPAPRQQTNDVAPEPVRVSVDSTKATLTTLEDAQGGWGRLGLAIEQGRLLDRQGRPLASAIFVREPEGLAAIDARPSHELLAYYFLRGSQYVVIEQGSSQQAGRILGTHWTPRGRVWLLQAEVSSAA
jgi:hypothetical protein